MSQIFKIILAHFLNYEFLYIFVFLSLIFFIFAAYAKNKKIKLVLIILFSVFIALGCSEFILSFYFEKIGIGYKFNLNPQNTQKKRVIRKILLRHNGANIELEDGAIDDFMSDYKKLSEIIYDIKFTIYHENGARYTLSRENSEKSYIFLGCSFVFGSSVADEQTLPYYFSKLNGFKSNVVNLGYSGHSTNSALSILNSEVINNFTGKSEIERFFYVVMHDHIQRNFRMPGNEPSDSWLYDGTKWVLAGAKQPFGKIKLIFKRSYLFRRIFLNFIDEHNQGFYEHYLIRSLKKMDNIIREKYKSKLTVVIWNNIKIKPLINKLQTENLDYIILSEDFNSRHYQIAYDLHPNAKAYEEIANILYNHIIKDKK